MRPFIALLALLFLVLNPTAHAVQRNLTVTSSAGEQKRVALVIGNAAYKGSPLRNPVNDAKAMSDALNKLGFHVIEVIDAPQKEMNRAIVEFGKKLNSDTAALFFYAGHGLQVKGKNYLVPVDAQIDTESAVSGETVNMDTVMDQLSLSSVSIVILDACRNNPFERSFRKMGGGGLAQMDAPKGSFIAYATAPGKTASDGDGKNGLFTQELLKQISTPGLSLEGVFKRVRANVSKATSDAQMPWDSSSLTGDFYFKPGDATQVASLVPVPVQPARIKSKEEIEDDAWNTAESLNTIEAINTYLSGYPKGRYVTQARMKLTTLKAEAARPVSVPAPVPQPAVPVASPKPAVNNTAGLSIACTGDDVDAGIWINGVLKGECPVDLKLPEGEIDLKVLKPVDAEHERIYERKLHLAADSVKKVEVKLVLQLTAQGKMQAEQEEEDLWKKAETGNSWAAVDAYLKKYPSGRHAAAAKEKLDTIGYVSQGGLTWMPVTFRKTWPEANSYCANTTIRGQTGWRLPTKDELVALYKSGAMNDRGWILDDYTWSSTLDRTTYYYVKLNGRLYSDAYSYYAYSNNDRYYVTCVR